jgi:L-malate glycosyltransferase
MKILVYAHQLEIGGTQVNAIELTAALRDLYGYEVVLFATPGPMVKLVEEKGLRFLPAPEPRSHPSVARMTALRAAVRLERPDVLHVWDWWQCVDAYYALHLPIGIPMVVTDMNMFHERVLPMSLPTTFGTPKVRDQARAAGHRQAELLLPAVDVSQNAPAVVDPKPFRERLDIDDTDIALVTVSRLSGPLKGESLLRTVDAVRSLGRDLPLRFVIVGDGAMHAELERRADAINRELGRPAIMFAGALLDPRPAYAAADIVIGMGGSALRGMAFAKPVIIVGERSFSAPFTPETADSFYYNGIYGLGNGKAESAPLAADIRAFAERREQLQALGDFSRQFVVRHFSIETVCAQLAEYCRCAAERKRRLHIAAADGIRTAAVMVRERKFLRDGHFLRRRIRDLFAAH